MGARATPMLVSVKRKKEMATTGLRPKSSPSGAVMSELIAEGWAQHTAVSVSVAAAGGGGGCSTVNGRRTDPGPGGTELCRRR